MANFSRKSRKLIFWSNPDCGIFGMASLLSRFAKIPPMDSLSRKFSGRVFFGKPRSRDFRDVRVIGIVRFVTIQNLYYSCCRLSHDRCSTCLSLLPDSNFDLKSLNRYRIDSNSRAHMHPDPLNVGKWSRRRFLLSQLVYSIQFSPKNGFTCPALKLISLVVRALVLSTSTVCRTEAVRRHKSLNYYSMCVCASSKMPL